MKPYLLSCIFFCLMACQANQGDGNAMETVLAPQETSYSKEMDLAPLPEVPLDPNEPQFAPPAPVEPNSPPQANTTKSPAKPIARQIIRNADISFQVKEVGNSAKMIEAVVKSFNGVIVSSEETRSGNELRQNLTVRIPASQLDTFLTVLLKESIYTERKTMTAQDVTKQYVDLEARIKAKKVTEEKYLEILKKARNVEEVLQVEQQLGQMREEIESREAQLRELKNDVAMSTIHASFYQKSAGEIAPEEPFYAKIWSSFLEGFDLLSGVFLGFFYFMPVLVVFGGAGWWLVRWWRKRRK